MEALGNGSGSIPKYCDTDGGDPQLLTEQRLIPTVQSVPYSADLG
jgi:hypothetical protein